MSVNTEPVNLDLTGADTLRDGLACIRAWANRIKAAGADAEERLLSEAVAAGGWDLDLLTRHVAASMGGTTDGHQQMIGTVELRVGDRSLGTIQTTIRGDGTAAVTVANRISDGGRQVGEDTTGAGERSMPDAPPAPMAMTASDQEAAPWD